MITNSVVDPAESLAGQTEASSVPSGVSKSTDAYSHSHSHQHRRVSFSDEPPIIDGGNNDGDPEPEDFGIPEVEFRGGTRRRRREDGRGQPQSHLQHPPDLTFMRRVAAGSGHILNDLCASLWFTYFLLYMEKVVGFTERNSAILMLLGQVVDALSTPLIGYEADRPNHCCLCRRGYGRCKSWHLIGVILVSISFPFVFSPCIGCSDSSAQWVRAIYYGPFIAIFQIGWAASQISHLALIPKLSSDILIRTEMLAIRYAFTVTANITVFLLTWLLLGFGNCEINSSDAYKFRTLGILAVGIGGFFSIIFHALVVERTDDEAKKLSITEANSDADRISIHSKDSLVESLNAITNVRSVASSMAISKVQAQERRRRLSTASAEQSVGLLSDHDDLADNIVEASGQGGHAHPEGSGGAAYFMEGLNSGKESVSVGEWMMMPQFYIVAIMYMATRLNINITQAYMPLYLQESLHLECGSVATIPLTMFCSGFVVSIFIKYINKKLGRLLAYGLGAAFCTIGAGLILFLDWTPGSSVATKEIYGIAVLLGGGASAILVTSLSITSDMIGNNIESGAFVYGAMSFCDKLSCGLGIMLINELKTLYRDTGFYQRVLGYTAASCSVVGVLGVTGLTCIIYRQRLNVRNI